MNYSCAVSLIIPVYNAENYLEDCLQSVKEQTFFSNTEVIIIDDGSTDNSLALSKKFSETHNNVKVINQSHSGVSEARNNGLNNASGKYIMFLDADDRLSDDTIASVYEYFETVYDLVDVVTYPEVRMESGKKQPTHQRYNILKDTGIYDLNQHIYICQSRLNVAIKNSASLRKFDTSLQTAEDQAFLASLLADKMKLGFVNKGAYFYNLHGNSLSFSKAFIYYVAENINNYYKRMFDSFTYNVPPYFQALFLYDLDWKIKKDQLWPYHYNNEKFDEYKKILIDLLQKCNNKVIIGHPSLDFYHKIYLLKLKNASVIPITDREELRLVCDDSIIFKANKITIVVCQFKIIDEYLKIVAHLKNPLFSFTDKPRLFVILNQYEKYEVDLFESTASRYRTKMKTNLFWGFYFENELESMSNIHFQVEIDGFIYDTDFYFMPQTPICLKQGINSLIGDKHIIKVTNTDIESVEYSVDEKMQYFNKVRTELLHTNPELFEVFKNFDIFKRRTIWLYYDCRNVDIDNGYYQFIHDFEKNDGILRYYISNNDDIPEGLFGEKHNKYIIQFGSFLHKILFINAQKVITAYIEKNNVYPFSLSEMQLIGNWISTEFIYLQHGILHASIPWKYTPESTQIDKIVVSSEFEINNFINKYNFRDADLLKTGMPRFDSIKKTKKGGKRILFAPSWRNYLITPQVDNYWEPRNEIFVESDYYQNICSLINSNRLNNLLEENGYVLEFKLHPIFYSAYKHFFMFESERIRFSDSTVKISNYDILITDYSSISFDFAYLKRTIIYYIPDMEQFRSGMNQYRELDLEYENAFGPHFYTIDDTINYLEDTLKNDSVPEVEYYNRMMDFFIKKANRCEAIYKKIMQ